MWCVDPVTGEGVPPGTNGSAQCEWSPPAQPPNPSCEPWLWSLGAGFLSLKLWEPLPSLCLSFLICKIGAASLNGVLRETLGPGSRTVLCS